jgi:hypothetical protein
MISPVSASSASAAASSSSQDFPRQSSLTAAALHASFTPSSTGVYSIDVTSSLQAWLANPSSYFGWVLNPKGSDGVDIDSFEGGVKPMLLVNYVAPANLPVVTIAATVPSAAEPTGALQFEVTRDSDDTSRELTVYYTLGGTAIPGEDYTTTADPVKSVVIPVGSTSANITLPIRNDDVYEGSETVTVTLASNAAYAIGSSSTATASIGDDELPPAVVTIVATTPTAYETGGDGVFTVTRSSDDTSSPLTVYYSVSGTATAGSDYNVLSGEVIIPVRSRNKISCPISSG